MDTRITSLVLYAKNWKNHNNNNNNNLFIIPEIHQSGYRICQYITINMVRNKCQQ